MDLGMVFVGTIVAGVILFFWMGFTQNVLPWGIKSVKENPDFDNLTPQIKRISENGVFYSHKDVAAFIAIKPSNYYNVGRYFAIEFVTQLLVGFTLTSMVVLTYGMANELRLLMIALVALAGIFSVDVQYWNWWGFSNIYTLGMAINRLVGYLITGFVLITFIVR